MAKSKKKKPAPKKVIKKLISKKVIKKTVSKTEQKARNKWTYTKYKKNKEIREQLKALGKKDEKSFIKFEGKKRKVSTVKNLLKVRAVKNNTAIGKEISVLEKQFKRKIRPTKKRPGSVFGILKSPAFYAWETKEAKLWVSGARVAGKDFYLPTYYMEIDALVMLMTSGDKFQMQYNKKDNNPDTRFSAYIIK